MAELHNISPNKQKIYKVFILSIFLLLKTPKNCVLLCFTSLDTLLVTLMGMLLFCFDTQEVYNASFPFLNAFLYFILLFGALGITWSVVYQCFTTVYQSGGQSNFMQILLASRQQYSYIPIQVAITTVTLPNYYFRESTEVFKEACQFK